MKPVCVKCKRFFRVEKIGVRFVEGMQIATGAKPGDEEPEKWKPYKLWSGDLMKCPGCTQEIISGFANLPLSEHFEDDFMAKIKKYEPKLQVNDY